MKATNMGSLPSRRVAVILLALLQVSSAANSSSSSSSNFYQRYAEYPEYCSTPEQMSKRSIPKLRVPGSHNEGGNSSTSPGSAAIGKTELLHVTAILRHGARTPWGPNLNCWEDYHTNPETGVWDCNLTAYLAPPPPARAQQEGTGSGSEEEEAMFLFEKRYDALMWPENNLSNDLNGTCQVGQLILQGYQQEITNGKFLRDAYVYNTHHHHSGRMKLIDALSPSVWNDIYFRVDDEARTLMSGQLVFRGLLGSELHQFYQDNGYYPVIPLHTADYHRDVVDPNREVCPRLVELQEQVEKSPDFVAFNSSDEANTLQQFRHEVLKIDPNREMDAIDCLMTTMCTDRPLPDAVNDYGDGESEIDSMPADLEDQYGNNLFQRLVEFQTRKRLFTTKANDAEFAKLGIGPLWAEIMDKIYPHIERENEDERKVKLSVFSGHDSTIMPIMASLHPDLWPDDAWPPYASMILLEIHSVETTAVFSSGFAFRLIYNGNVMTSQIPDCPADLELCDVNVLVERVSQFATRTQDCQRRTPPPPTTTTTSTTQPQDDEWTDTTTSPTIAPTTLHHYSNYTITLPGTHGIQLDLEAETEDILSTPEGKAYLALIVIGSALFGAVAASLCCCITGMASPRYWRCGGCRPCGGRRRRSIVPQEEDGRYNFHGQTPPRGDYFDDEDDDPDL